MDRTLACGADDPGSIPGGRTKIADRLFFCSQKGENLEREKTIVFSCVRRGIGEPEGSPKRNEVTT